MAAAILGQYLVYLVASGDKEGATKLLKEWRWLLDYDSQVSVTARLVFRLFGVGGGQGWKRLWAYLTHGFYRSICQLYVC